MGQVLEGSKFRPQALPLFPLRYCKYFVRFGYSTSPFFPGPVPGPGPVSECNVFSAFSCRGDDLGWYSWSSPYFMGIEKDSSGGSVCLEAESLEVIRNRE